MSATPGSDTTAGEYTVEFTRRGRDSLSGLQPEERKQALRKLEQVASGDFRKPWEWGFERMEGISEGRLKLSDGLRAFTDIDQQNLVVRVYGIERRENLYG